MEAVAHNPAFAKKAGVPQSVGKDYSAADKGKTFKKGDAIMMKKSMGMPSSAAAEMMARRLGAKPRSMGMAPGMKKGGSLERLGEPQNFKNAFKEARGEGVSTFTWRGKKYGTDLAAPSKAAPSNEDARDLTAKQKPNYGDETARMLARSPKPVEADLGDLPMKKGGMPMKGGKPAFMKGMNMGGTAKYAKGGSVSARADGIATKGKTKGKMI